MATEFPAEETLRIMFKRHSMRRLSPGSLTGGLGLVLLVATATGCHKPADASADLANAVKVLEASASGYLQAMNKLGHKLKASHTTQSAT